MSRHIVLFGLVLAIATLIRVLSLSHFPVSPYWEEVALGYDAYSLLQTGKDHHGDAYPLVALTSFGDYKPAGYVYALLPSIWLFGLSVTAVRLPSAVAGVLIVLGIGLLTKEVVRILEKKATTTQLEGAFLIGMLVSAFSPWLIQFSRGGWEVNLATCFVLWGVVWSLWSIRSRRLWGWIVAALLFSAAVYTYHATRVIAPVLFLTLMGVYVATEIRSHRRVTKRVLMPFIAVVGFFLAITPVLLAARTPAVQQRISETSILQDPVYVQTSNGQRDAVGANDQSVVARVLTHRYFFLLSAVVTNFNSHFTPKFLFISGDENLRHGTGFFGIFYPFDAPFFLLGAVAVATAVAQGREKYTARLVGGFFLIWLVIGILPASISTATPHALRILPSSPVFIVLLSLGYLRAWIWLQKQHRAVFCTSILLLCCVMSVQLFRLWHVTTRIYPALAGTEWWQYGYKEMIETVNNSRDGETPVFITRERGRPAMYFWFYSKTPPHSVQSAEATSPKDQGEFLAFEEVVFINSVNEAGKGIIASSQQGFDQLQQEYPGQIEQLRSISDLRGQVVWVVSRVR